VLAKSPVGFSGEYAIHDYEGFGPCCLGEYASLESVHDMAEFDREYTEIAGELLKHFRGSLDDATNAAEEQYAGCYESLADYTQELTEQTTDILASLTLYIDYEKLGRDVELGGDVLTIEASFNEVHIFWAH
jgi:antirestriction protein